MPISLYQATIPTFIQVGTALRALLDKAQAHCAERGLADSELIDARLIDDMWTFAYQVRSVANHSYGAIKGLRAGVFGPYYEDVPGDFAGLKREIDESLAGLQGLDEAELDDFIGKPMRFEAGELKFAFTAENFLLSFSQPNFFFHATTAYDILRARGVELGKRDFLAGIRVEQGSI